MSAARLLAARNFSVRADYTYARRYEENEKYFSVDVIAHGYAPSTSENDLLASLHLLVECKYRHPGTIRSLAAGQPFHMKRLFNQFFVCDMENFPKLLDGIISSVDHEVSVMERLVPRSDD